ncbi:MAG: hypothetical protein U9P71_03385 [Campylobacterota bacterium]|nr:hypothetical protein [Campylobacterota bacterium]
MNIVSSSLYEEQLKAILAPMAKANFSETKKFKMYLDTIILNAPTKAKKYKKSIYFNNENIKDIEHQGYTIIFYMDIKTGTYVILGITADQ